MYFGNYYFTNAVSGPDDGPKVKHMQTKALFSLLNLPLIPTYSLPITANCTKSLIMNRSLSSYNLLNTFLYLPIYSNNVSGAESSPINSSPPELTCHDPSSRLGVMVTRMVSHNDAHINITVMLSPLKALQFLLVKI